LKADININTKQRNARIKAEESPLGQGPYEEGAQKEKSSGEQQ